MKKIDFKKILGYFYYKSYKGTKIKVIRDWKVLISLFALLLIVVFLVDMYIFLNFRKKVDADIDITEELGIKVVNKTLLSEVLKEINQRQIDFEKSLQRLEIQDPSI